MANKHILGCGGSEGNIALLSVLSASGVLVEHDGLHKMLLLHLAS